MGDDEDERRHRVAPRYRSPGRLRRPPRARGHLGKHAPGLKIASRGLPRDAPAAMGPATGRIATGALRLRLRGRKRPALGRRAVAIRCDRCQTQARRLGGNEVRLVAKRPRPPADHRSPTGRPCSASANRLPQLRLHRISSQRRLLPDSRLLAGHRKGRDSHLDVRHDGRQTGHLTDEDERQPRADHPRARPGSRPTDQADQRRSTPPAGVRGGIASAAAVAAQHMTWRFCCANRPIPGQKLRGRQFVWLRDRLTRAAGRVAA